MANIAGRSGRVGSRKRPMTNNKAKAVSPDNTARPSANHNGVEPAASAVLVSGHALDSSTTDARSCSKPPSGTFGATSLMRRRSGLLDRRGFVFFLNLQRIVEPVEEPAQR